MFAEHYGNSATFSLEKNHWKASELFCCIAILETVPETWFDFFSWNCGKKFYEKWISRNRGEGFAMNQKCLIQKPSCTFTPKMMKIMRRFRLIIRLRFSFSTSIHRAISSARYKHSSGLLPFIKDVGRTYIHAWRGHHTWMDESSKEPFHRGRYAVLTFS